METKLNCVTKVTKCTVRATVRLALCESRCCH